MEFSKQLDNNLILEVIPEEGIKTGLVSGMSYTDANGNQRHKYETKTTYSSTFIKNKLNETLLIPINMRDGSLICVGKGNKDWNYSAPHGTGRLFSRNKAKEAFSMDDFKEQMKGIYTTTMNESTLDECPMAYKSMKNIVDNIGETVNIIKIIKPLDNFKATD